MKEITCDKCGAVIRKSPIQQCVFPYYKISAFYINGFCEIDLCDECQKKLYDWLNSPVESGEEF